MNRQPRAPLKPGPPQGIRSALVATADQAHARIDRASLRRARIPAAVTLYSGRKALAYLSENPVDVVLCDSDLGDMTGLDFIRRARAKDKLARPPVLTMSLDGRESAVLDAIAAGCAGYLLRPYSLSSFLYQLKNVRQGMDFKAAEKAALEKARQDAAKGCLDKAAQGFERVAKTHGDALRHYEQGRVHLTGRRYNKAIAAFQKAVTLYRLFAEAYVGLAEAWQAKGRQDKHDQYMRKAAEAYVRLNEFRKAREVFVDVLRKDAEKDNPFLELGFTLVRQGDFAGAARAYVQAEKFNKRASVHASLARACHFTANPVQTAQKAAKAWADETGEQNASTVFRRIMGDCIPRKALAYGPARSASLIPPRLGELWNVCKYTYKLFRNNGCPPYAFEPLEV